MGDPMLACILARSDDEAAAAWRRWRSATDIDSIEWRHALMVPMVREDLLQHLVSGDRDAPRLTGLVRRAWTLGATRAADARKLVAQLAASGVSPVMIGGSLAAFLHRGATGPIRPVTDIVLLMPRYHVDRGIAVLREMGWVPEGAAPKRKAYSWTACATMRIGKDTLRVGWRHVGTPPWRSRAAERALFAQPCEILPLEALLLSRLSAGGAWPDSLPWQADVALLAARSPDWDSLFRDAARFAPDALGWLRELSGAVPGVPEGVPRAGTLPLIERALWRSARAAILAAHRATSRR